MATIVQTVEGFRERLMANGTQLTLMSVRHLALFMGFNMTTQRAIHRGASSLRPLCHYIIPH